ncbi:MAG TPA: protein kinase [Pirellulaceae bacterium]|nr:protein kinase [Pirellulaceae bacterium]HMO92925.1 protein kinase [Pirellulaceae bacterium]HMP71054.1 protein kinase [Pirellulaceae bacterium]
MSGQHLNFDELRDFAAGRVDDEEHRRRIEDHVLTCLECCAAMEACPADDFESQLSSLACSEILNSAKTDRYELIEEIGRGGAGIVYRGKQAGLERQIAIKMLLRGVRANRSELSRFRRESVALARLSHRNVVQIYDCGEMDGVPFIAMEYVEGPTLAERLRQGPLDARLAAQWICALSDAMAQAHELGIRHRDLKPQNILLAGNRIADRKQVQADEASPDMRSTGAPHRTTDSVNDQSRHDDSLWTPKLVDFGLAYCEDSTRFHTATGETLGTPAYMAPEAIGGRGKAIGEESVDIYGLGAILYECLTGRPPFMGSSTWEILEAVAHREPVSITSLRAGVPRDLVTICSRCLDKRPERRFASARELADDLDRFINGHPIHSRRVSRIEKTWRWARRRPATAIAALLASILMTAIPLLLLYQNQSVQQERNLARTQYAAVRASLHDVLAELNRNTGTVIPEATQLAARQVAIARQMFEQLAEVDGSPQSDLDLGKVLVQSATIDMVLGHSEQAAQSLDLAEQRYRKHEASESHRFDSLRGLFQVYVTRSTLLQSLQQMDGAGDQLDCAQQIVEQLAQLHPQSNTSSEIALLIDRQRLFQSRGNWAQRTGDLAAAEQSYQSSLECIANLRDQQHINPDYLLAETGLRINLASIQMQTQQYTAAEATYQQALTDLEKWSEDNARTSKWVEDWSTAVLNRSNLLNQLARTDEALATLDRARQVLGQAIESDPDRVELRNLLFMISANRAMFCRDTSRKIDLWRDAVSDAYRPEHAIFSRQMFVRVLAGQGEPLAAWEELRQIDVNDLDDQQKFVQASCYALIAKHLADDDFAERAELHASIIGECVRQSQNLLQELAADGHLNQTRREHLKTSDDWSALELGDGNILGFDMVD